MSAQSSMRALLTSHLEQTWSASRRFTIRHFQMVRAAKSIRYSDYNQNPPEIVEFQGQDLTALISQISSLRRQRSPS